MHFRVTRVHQQGRYEMTNYNLGSLKNEMAIARDIEDGAMLRQGGFGHLTGKARREMIKLIRSEIANG